MEDVGKLFDRLSVVGYGPILNFLKNYCILSFYMFRIHPTLGCVAFGIWLQKVLIFSLENSLLSFLKEARASLGKLYLNESY